MTSITEIEAEAETLDEAIARMTNRTDEERAAALAYTLATLRPRIPPPPGSNGMEFVIGHWPGDETDEQIEAALEELERE